MRMKFLIRISGEVKRLFRKRDEKFYIVKSINHLRHLRKKHPSHQNSTTMSIVLESFIVANWYYLVNWVIFFTLAILLTPASIIAFFYVSYGIVVNSFREETFTVLKEKIAFNHLIEISFTLLFLSLLGIEFCILLFNRPFDASVKKELKNRIKSLINRVDFETLSFIKIKEYLNKEVSLWDIDDNTSKISPTLAFNDTIIIDPIMLAKLIELCEHFNKGKGVDKAEGREQINRIGAYAFKCGVIKKPKGFGYKGKMFNIWQGLNGGIGATGSKMLIHTPNHMRKNQGKGKIKEKLNELKDRFISIDFVKGIEKIEEDKIAIS